MNAMESFEHEWSYLLSFLPEEQTLEDTARSWGAIQRRRAVDRASTLLRLALVYGFCGYSLRQTAAWAEAAQVACLSDVALLNRLRKTPDWLGHLLALKLAERVTHVPENQTRIRLVDATSVSAPASKGTDWRVHLDFDLGTLAISEIQLTTRDGGESLFRYDFDPGELVVADRGYAHRPGLAHVLDSGAQFLVRLNPVTVPLQKPGGEAFDLVTALRDLPEAEPKALALEIQPHLKQKIPALPVRLVALRKSEEAAEVSRQKVLKEAARKGKTVRPQTLELASYMLVVTSTPEAELSANEVLEIYRFRWQIELVFKRIKSLLKLKELPAKDPKLAQAFLFAKLLAAILLEDLTTDYLSISPWGYRLRPTTTTTIAVAHPSGSPA